MRPRADGVTQLGEQILRAMAQRGLTQRAAAAKLGFAYQTLNDIIHGRRAPNVKKADRLREVLGVTVRGYAARRKVISTRKGRER